ncbi:hypothetical protein Y1Q_0022816 [Alligator mississippiensis]|uniref:Uncharacterized protein n=1 Tax=Alligator mississippiensis TaxID=8496 RepID=A0A151N4L4_ALLMI|nr:hypothetical protein Y1Q_0022816 [Alligator mississippiensis]
MQPNDRPRLAAAAGARRAAAGPRQEAGGGERGPDRTGPARPARPLRPLGPGPGKQSAPNREHTQDAAKIGLSHRVWFVPQLNRC